VVVTAHIDHLGIAAARNAVGGDSVFNGADDGGTGAMALLEIAERLGSPGEQPQRSVLLLWTTGEEQGGIGAQWFVDNPTVPVESIVASINLDMIGRGTVRDIPGGGPAYARVVGSSRLSAEFGSWLQEVNALSDQSLELDYGFDDDDHRAAHLCVGDHAVFYRAGIPSVFITTGTHADFHRVSDEVERIDYEKLARVTRFAARLAVDIANRPARPRINAASPRAGPDCRPSVTLR
jgi:Zn-dependent M28 family amino/carboxypeptidase